MVSILAHAQQLVYILLSFMPSQYQRESLESIPLDITTRYAQSHPQGGQEQALIPTALQPQKFTATASSRS